MQDEPQVKAATESESAPDPVDPNIEKAELILKNEPFNYGEPAILAAIKKRGAEAITTARGQFLTLLDEWANHLPFQLTARLEKLVDRHHPAE